METILDVLRKMGKATARDIAARMKIDVRETLDMLREHEERIEVCQVNGMWQLSTNMDTTPPATRREVKPAPTNTTAAITADNLSRILREKGPMTADELARFTGTTSRKIASTLAMATNRGRVIRKNINGRFCYCIPEVVAAAVDAELPTLSISTPPAVVTVTVTPDTPPEKIQTERDEQFVQTIPSLTASVPTSIQVPTLGALAKEIRKTRTRLAHLERCRGALRELNKFKKALNEGS